MRSARRLDQLSASAIIRKVCPRCATCTLTTICQARSKIGGNEAVRLGPGKNTSAATPARASTPRAKRMARPQITEILWTVSSMPRLNNSRTITLSRKPICMRVFGKKLIESCRARRCRSTCSKDAFLKMLVRLTRRQKHSRARNVHRLQRADDGRRPAGRRSSDHVRNRSKSRSDREKLFCRESRTETRSRSEWDRPWTQSRRCPARSIWFSSTPTRLTTATTTKPAFLW